MLRWARDLYGRRGGHRRTGLMVFFAQRSGVRTPHHARRRHCRDGRCGRILLLAMAQDADMAVDARRWIAVGPRRTDEDHLGRALPPVGRYMGRLAVRDRKKPSPAAPLPEGEGRLVQAGASGDAYPTRSVTCNALTPGPSPKGRGETQSVAREALEVVSIFGIALFI